MKKSILLLSILSLITVNSALAAKNSSSTTAKKINVSEDVDTLGGNEDLMKMAQSLKSETRSRVVQDRIVDRNNAFEFGLSYGGVLGGDSYLKTQSVGVAADFHFTPRWSIGARYFDFTNSLTPEGDRIAKQARQSYNAGNQAIIFDTDYPINATMGVINWYPIYGKTSFLDMGVTQFDLYLTVGAGNMELSSGTTGVYNAGLGIGAWLSKHISVRAEAKYQTYKDQLVTGSRTLNTTVATIGLGWII